MTLYRKFIRPMHCYPGFNYDPKTEPVEKEEKWYPEEDREQLEKTYGYLNAHFSDLVFDEKYEPYLDNAIEEAVKPVVNQDEWVCGCCGTGLERQKMIHPNAILHDLCDYCPKCGKKVNWEAVEQDD